MLQLKIHLCCYRPKKARLIFDFSAKELYQKITTANSVLSDPSERRHYNLHGIKDKRNSDGNDITDLSFFGRLCLGGFTSIGFPYQTVINAKVLSEAGKRTDQSFGSKVLEPGKWCRGEVQRQSGDFFTIPMKEEWQKHGVLIRCEARHGNRFKMAMFDRQGKVLIFC